MVGKLKPADDARRSARAEEAGNVAQLADSRARVLGQQLRAWLNHSLEQ
jgi:hypothetical protein